MHCVFSQLDYNKLNSHKLYRQHVYNKRNVVVKNLSILRRDLKNKIQVDNLVVNFQMQYENGVFISSWVGGMNDDTLMQLGKNIQGNV